MGCPRGFPTELPWCLERFGNVASTTVSTYQYRKPRYAYTSFSSKMPAICSLSQSNSLRAEYVNSSTSVCAIWRAEERSSAIHAAEPIWRRGPRIVVMFDRGVCMTKWLLPG